MLLKQLGKTLTVPGGNMQSMVMMARNNIAGRLLWRRAAARQPGSSRRSKGPHEKKASRAAIAVNSSTGELALG